MEIALSLLLAATMWALALLIVYFSQQVFGRLFHIEISGRRKHARLFWHCTAFPFKVILPALLFVGGVLLVFSVLGHGFRGDSGILAAIGITVIVLSVLWGAFGGRSTGHDFRLDYPDANRKKLLMLWTGMFVSWTVALTVSYDIVGSFFCGSTQHLSKRHYGNSIGLSTLFETKRRLSSRQDYNRYDCLICFMGDLLAQAHHRPRPPRPRPVRVISREEGHCEACGCELEYDYDVNGRDVTVTCPRCHGVRANRHR
ncbi:MAG: hypothetical protein IJR99_13000 [Kiritimatiellae bacterium]|nr:hypothetical protein [Kiritimatiellia bacterium]